MDFMQYYKKETKILKKKKIIRVNKRNSFSISLQSLETPLSVSKLVYV